MKLLLENWRKYLNEVSRHEQRHQRDDVTFEFFEKLIELAADNPEKYHMTPARLTTIMRYMSILPPSEAGWLLNLIRRDQQEDGVSEEDLLDIDIFSRTKEEPKKRHLPFLDDDPEEEPQKHYPWDDEEE